MLEDILAARGRDIDLRVEVHPSKETLTHTYLKLPSKQITSYMSVKRRRIFTRIFMQGLPNIPGDIWPDVCHPLLP